MASWNGVIAGLAASFFFFFSFSTLILVRSFSVSLFLSASSSLALALAIISACFFSLFSLASLFKWARCLLYAVWYFCYDGGFSGYQIGSVSYSNWI